MASITEGELLEALTAAVRGAAPKDAKTVQEIADSSGVGYKRARRALALLKQQGRLVVHWIHRESLDGRQILVAGYTINPPSKKKR